MNSLLDSHQLEISPQWLQQDWASPIQINVLVPAPGAQSKFVEIPSEIFGKILSFCDDKTIQNTLLTSNSLLQVVKGFSGERIFTGSHLFQAIVNKSFLTCMNLLTHSNLDPSFEENKLFKQAIQQTKDYAPALFESIKDSNFETNYKARQVYMHFRENFEALLKELADSNLDKELHTIEQKKYYESLYIVELLLKQPTIQNSVRAVRNWSVGDLISNRESTGLLELFLKYENATHTSHKKQNYNEELETAAEYEHVEMLKLLLEYKRADPTADNNKFFTWACDYGQSEIMMVLLKDKRIDPTCYNNYLLKSVTIHNQVEILEMLLKDERVDPTFDNYYLIYEIIEQERTEMFKLLYKDDRFLSVDRRTLIRKAIKHNQVKIVELLVLDLLVRNSEFDLFSDSLDIIGWATANDKKEIIDSIVRHKKFNSLSILTHLHIFTYKLNTFF